MKNLENVISISNLTLDNFCKNCDNFIETVEEFKGSKQIMIWEPGTLPKTYDVYPCMIRVQDPSRCLKSGASECFKRR